MCVYGKDSLGLVTKITAPSWTPHRAVSLSEDRPPSFAAAQQLRQASPPAEIVLPLELSRFPSDETV